MGNKSSAINRGLTPDNPILCGDWNCRTNWKPLPALSPIFGAIEANNCRLLRKLIKSGHIIDTTDYKGFSPLHRAAIDGNEACLLLLLESGAQLSDRPFGMTALHCAAPNGTKAMIDILVDYGSKVNAKDTIGLTPLAEAVKSDNTDTAMALLRRGATLEPNVCVLALQRGFTQLFRDLLNCRPSIVADIELKDYFWLTRDTATGLKILYFAGFPIDGTLMSRIKPLDHSSEYSMTGRITLPRHQYNRDQVFEAYESFINWFQSREDVMSLKCLSRLAFRKACNGNSMEKVLGQVGSIPNHFKKYLLLQDIND